MTEDTPKSSFLQPRKALICFKRGAEEEYLWGQIRTKEGKKIRWKSTREKIKHASRKMNFRKLAFQLLPFISQLCLLLPSIHFYYLMPLLLPCNLVYSCKLIWNANPSLLSTLSLKKMEHLFCFTAESTIYDSNTKPLANIYCAACSKNTYLL